MHMYNHEYDKHMHLLLKFITDDYQFHNTNNILTSDYAYFYFFFSRPWLIMNDDIFVNLVNPRFDRRIHKLIVGISTHINLSLVVFIKGVSVQNV